MFENETMEVILKRLLDLIPKDNSIAPDSPLYIMGAAVSSEWESFYKKQSEAVDQCFWDSASLEYLIRHAEPYGIVPYGATPSEVEGKFDIKIDIGTRFSKGEVNFTTTKYLRQEDGFYYFSLECEQPGEIGNVAPGRILAINFVNDLTVAEITRVLVLGEEAEDVEDFRERFIANFNNKRFCGNVADYLTELMEQPGVGKAKVLRCRDNTGAVNPEWVTVVITDSNFGKPTEELIGQIQEFFQPLDEVTGLPTTETSGIGISPIGQLCWVRGVNEKTIDVALNLSFEEGYSWETTKESIEEAIKQYFKDKVEEDWGDTVTTQRSYRPMDYFLTLTRFDIYSILSEIDGIMNSDALKLNGNFADLSLAWDEIPVLGELSRHTETEIPGTGGSCPYNCPDCNCNKNMEVCERCQHI